MAGQMGVAGPRGRVRDILQDVQAAPGGHCGQVSTDNATALNTSNVCYKLCRIIIYRTITKYVLLIYVPMQMAMQLFD